MFAANDGSLALMRNRDPEKGLTLYEADGTARWHRAQSEPASQFYDSRRFALLGYDRSGRQLAVQDGDYLKVLDGAGQELMSLPFFTSHSFCYFDAEGTLFAVSSGSAVLHQLVIRPAGGPETLHTLQGQGWLRVLPGQTGALLSSTAGHSTKPVQLMRLAANGIAWQAAAEDMSVNSIPLSDGGALLAVAWGPVPNEVIRLGPDGKPVWRRQLSEAHYGDTCAPQELEDGRICIVLQPVVEYRGR